MFQDVIKFPNKSQLTIIEYETGHYVYKYSEFREETTQLRRRWEWHTTHGEPHIHDYSPPFYIEKKSYSKVYTLKEVLNEIKNEFKVDINVESMLKMITDR